MLLPGFKMLCFPLFALAVITCHGQTETVFTIKKNQRYNDLHEMQLKGKVKAITVYSCDLTSRLPDQKDSVSHKYVISFNKEGNITTVLDTDNTETDAARRESRMLFKYNNTGNQVEVLSYRKGKYAGKYLRTYNEKHRLTREMSYDMNGAIQSGEVCTYDSLGNAICNWAPAHDGDGGAEARSKDKSLIRYNDLGNEIVRTPYNSTGKFEHKDSIVYNGMGQRSETLASDTSQYKYVGKGKCIYGGYDENGNWTKRTQYSFDIPIFIEEQKLEYY